MPRPGFEPLMCDNRKQLIQLLKCDHKLGKVIFIQAKVKYIWLVRSGELKGLRKMPLK
jgi:hypothetical protein